MLVEFCLPVRNEEKILKNNLLKFLNYCLAQKFDFNWQMVVIVNGSTDQSWQIASELANLYPDYLKVINITQAGKGRAIKSYGQQSQAEIMVYMDIDLAVSLDNLSGLIEPIIKSEADLVIGSRLLPSSKTNRSVARTLSSKVYNWLAKIILTEKLSDLQCGFKAVKTSVFQKLAGEIQDEHWFFDTELLILANHFGYRIQEIAVDWEENRYDLRKSKVKLLRDGLIFLKKLQALKLRLLNIKRNFKNEKRDL